MNPLRLPSRAARFLTLTGCICASTLFLSVRSYGQGRVDVIALTGQIAPDSNGTFLSFSNVGLSSNGDVLFKGDLTGTSAGSSDNSGIFRGNGGAIDQLVRKGQLVPNGNGTYSGFNSVGYSISGNIAFQADLSGTSGGASDNSGIFRLMGGSTAQIAREGQTVPDGNGAYSTFFVPVINDVGQTAFVAGLSGTSGGSGDNGGVFRGDGASLTQIARMGQAISGGNLFIFSSPQLNSSGQVAFTASLFGTSGPNNNQGIYRGNGGSLTEMARKGSSAPGGGFFSFLGNPKLNASGQVAFHSTLTGTTGDEGIFRSGSATPIVKRNQVAPDGNGTFGTLSSSISLNDAGQVAFTSLLSGTVGGGSDNQGVFRGAGAELTQIARKGQAAPDSNGLLGSFFNQTLNDSGLVAFQATISGTTGGSVDDQGVFLGDGTELLQAVREGDSIGGSLLQTIVFASTNGLNAHGQIAYRGMLANGNQVVGVWTPDLHWRGSTSGNWEEANRWTLGIAAAHVHDVFVDPAASLTVTGPAANAAVHSLKVGGNTGLATFSLRNGAVLTAIDGVSIQSTGTLTGDGVIAGNVANFGTLVADNITVTGGVLTNYNKMLGDGRIHADVVNASGGEIRSSGGSSLLLSGNSLSNQAGGRVRALNGAMISLTGSSFTNAGLVEIHDGSEVQVNSLLVNQAGSGLVSIRNGSLIANSGISNSGSMAMTLGNSIIQGDINNAGTIQVSGGAHATFFDDVVQNGVMQIATVGNTSSTAVILGSLTGSGGFVGGGDLFALGDLRPGNSPASVLYDGSLFLGSSTDTYIELGGLAFGEFDQLVVTGELGLAGSLHVDLINGHDLGANQLYLIGDIAGLRSGQFAGLAEGDLVGIYGGRELFITYAGGNGNDIGLFTAIPEPTMAWLLLSEIAVWGTNPRRRISQSF